MLGNFKKPPEMSWITYFVQWGWVLFIALIALSGLFKVFSEIK